MYSEQEKKYYIKREQEDAKGSIKIVKRDFYDDLPRAVCEILDSISWRWRNYDWFEEAWNKYREHVINASAGGLAIKAPGFVFNDYIDEQVKQNFLDREQSEVLHSDSDLTELYVLYHHGIKGQKWGVRRYQNEDGTYTEAGKRERARRIGAVAIGGASGALIGGAVAAKHYLIGKKFVDTKKYTGKQLFQRSVAKTALAAIGASIVGGLIGGHIDEKRHNKEEKALLKTYGKEVPKSKEKKIGRIQ